MNDGSPYIYHKQNYTATTPNQAREPYINSTTSCCTNHNITICDMSMTGIALPPSLDALPDEVLQQILFYISPRDTLLNVQRVSKRFNRLGSEPLLWRYHCRVDFKYWDSKHRIKQKFLGGVGDVDWKALYTHRKVVDARTTELLNGILEGQISRIKRFDAIGKFGYDAKDTLLRHCHASEGTEDVLARR